ncbi:hypothetical protein C8Q74DRAFT_1362221 [Fomes fomentarius]|nr:hypothetical protein C8Q74DRAFT_1362221 [Fomes fomentarius]
MAPPSSIVLEISELLHIIGLSAERADLASLALANKTLNEGVTVLLYRVIKLDRCGPALRCMITLSTAPKRLAFGRDLASLVRVVDLSHPIILEHSMEIAEGLAQAFPRMVNLRRFSSTMRLPRYMHILRTLASTPFKSLESFKLSPYPDHDAGIAKKLQPFLPVLHTFQVDYRSVNTRIVVPVPEAILCSSAHCLRSLTLLGVPHDLLSLLPAFPTLETLEVQESQLDFPCFKHAKSVKSLILHHGYRVPKFTDDCFPNLEEIACLARAIRAFFPPTSGHRRPIRTVRLNNATFGDMSYISSHSEDSPRDISQAIAHFQFSASAVTTLGFCTDDLESALAVLTPLIQHLESIENLLLVLEDTPGDDTARELGLQLLALLPNLRTFLLSTPLPRAWGVNNVSDLRDLDRQSNVLAEFVKFRPTLKRVAFTKEVEWELKNGMWCHSPTDL